MEPSILVVGPGAVGLGLTAGLHRAGLAVAILGRSPSAENRLVRGFHLTATNGTRTTIRGRIVSARTLTAPVETAFFCVKAGDAARAAKAAKPWIGPRTAAVALQNGIGHEKLFRRVFGAKRTVIGACYFAVDRVAPGDVRLNGGNEIVLAQWPGNASALATAARTLARAGFRALIQSRESDMLWAKAAFNAAVNPLGAACAVESGKIFEDPALRELSLKALSEAVSTANKAGHPLDYSGMADKLLRSGRNAPLQRNSMLQDLSAGRRTEIHAILGPILRAARTRKIPTPTLCFLNDVISSLERNLPR